MGQATPEGLPEALRQVREACERVVDKCEAFPPAKEACDDLMKKCEGLVLTIEDALTDLQDLQEMILRMSVSARGIRAKEKAQRLKGLPRSMQFEEQTTDMGEEDSKDSEEYPVLPPPPKELLGGFAAVCHYLHLSLFTAMYKWGCQLEWEEFCNLLDDECASFPGQKRWCESVHSQLKKALEGKGFSKVDWEINLPTTDDEICLHSPVVHVTRTWVFVEAPGFLTPKQQDLQVRIRAFHHKGWIDEDVSEVTDVSEVDEVSDEDMANLCNWLAAVNSDQAS